MSRRLDTAASPQPAPLRPAPRRSTSSTAQSGKPDDAMLDVTAIAARLDVSTKTIRRAIKAGALRAYRLGRLVRVSEADLTAYLTSRRGPASGVQQG